MFLAVTQGLQFMLEVEDDPDWLTADNTESDDDNSRYVFRSLATALRMKK